MSDVVVINNLTLDGVMQAAGRPDVRKYVASTTLGVVISTYQSTEPA